MADNNNINDFFQFITTKLASIPEIKFQELYDDIKKLNNFEEFNDFNKSSYSLMKVREYIISLTKSRSGETLENFYKIWAQSLRMIKLRDLSMIVVGFGFTLVFH